MAKLIPDHRIIWLGKTEQLCKLLTLIRVVERLELFEFRRTHQAEIAQTVERRQSTHAEMVCDLHDVVELHGLGSGFAPALYVHASRSVEHLGIRAARFPLAKP